MSKEKQESNIRIFRGFAQLLALSFELTKQDEETDTNESNGDQDNVAYYY